MGPCVQKNQGEFMYQKILYILACSMILSGMLTNAGMASSDPVESYRLGAGDLISISVWKDESLTRQVSVLPDGTISFPLIGQVTAEGKSLDELKHDLGERLARFVPEPLLSLQVMKVNSLNIYVIGQVNRPGRFELMGNIDVLQALSLAGGLNSFAKSSKIKIFRQRHDGKRILKFDYDSVSKGKQLEQNILLNRGDVVVVP